MNVLTVRDLTCYCHGKPLFAPVSFDLTAGSALQITGSNGSGKTTLLRTLAGFLEIDQGSIVFNEKKWPDETLSNNLHYIGHKNSVKLNLTVLENMYYIATLYGVTPTPATIKRICYKLNLVRHLNTTAENLSVGQLRRLSLTRLLLQGVPMWILDEPTSALDAESVDVFTQLSTAYLGQGGMIVMATHHDIAIQSKIIQLECAYV